MDSGLIVARAEELLRRAQSLNKALAGTCKTYQEQLLFVLRENLAQVVEEARVKVMEKVKKDRAEIAYYTERFKGCKPISHQLTSCILLLQKVPTMVGFKISENAEHIRNLYT